MKTQFNKENTFIKKTVYFHSCLQSFVFLYAIEKYRDKINATLILHVGLYRCENWICTLREEHRIRVLENKVLTEYLSLKWRMIVGNG
jgi:hypothetical protein